jgi:hypothetical protein
MEEGCASRRMLQIATLLTSEPNSKKLEHQPRTHNNNCSNYVCIVHVHVYKGKGDHIIIIICNCYLAGKFGEHLIASHHFGT